MTDKIRSFKKADSERASKKTRVETLSVDLSIKEVDGFLKKRYGYGIWNFIYSLYWIATLYNLHSLRKETDLLTIEIDKLNTAKRRLIENIDQFLIETDIWTGIKNEYPELNIRWTPDKKEEFLVENFQLDRFFKIVDDKIEKIKRRKKYFEIFSAIPAHRLRIAPRNLIILVWSQVMRDPNEEDKIEFENIGILLNWFSINKNWANMFKSSKLVSPKTPELTYNKFIKFAKDDKYYELSNYLYADFFLDIALPLVQIFPNPLDLVRHEIGSKKSLALNKLKST